ncbi:MAG: penicillin-binding protein 2 [Planctomycetes bacterium]|nr:penicillin-binding protein 2 [Planctomycetota bacterium]
MGIVMSPRDGDVIAMAGYPTFDPNYHSESPSAHKRNRCLTDPVEPGSCFKPLIMSAALSEGVARLDETVDCGSGVWFFGSRRMRDTHANGKLTFEDVLVKSSNIGMGHIGTRLGNKALYEYVRAYGFGARTGISLPGESAGILAPLRKWSSYSKTSIPIGQELAVTPIQLATAFAALVNGGTLRPPRLVRMVLDSAGKQTTPDHQPRPPRQVVPREVADAVAKQALVRMVNESPHDIKLAKYQVLGKTGTAQVPYRNRRGYEPDAYIGSFLGAAPAHDPVVSVIVMIRKPKRSLGYYGGKVAGPAVREIIQKTLAYWDIPPDRDPASLATLAMNTAAE